MAALPICIERAYAVNTEFLEGLVTGNLAVGRQTHQYPNGDPVPAMNFSLLFSGVLKPRPQASDKRAIQIGTTSQSGNRPSSTYKLLRVIVHVYDVLASSCAASLIGSITLANVEKMRQDKVLARPDVRPLFVRQKSP